MLKDNCRLAGKYWRLARSPLLVAGFVCLIYYCHYRENARMVAAEAAMEAASLAVPAAPPAVETPEAAPDPAPRPDLSGLTDFHATAYCITGTTYSGEETRHGYVAADLKVIPLGSLIYIESPLMGGAYQVMDIGSKVKGKSIDIFLPGYERCRMFGRRKVRVKVLRYGFAKNQGRGAAARLAR